MKTRLTTSQSRLLICGMEQTKRILPGRIQPIEKELMRNLHARGVAARDIVGVTGRSIFSVRKIMKGEK